MFNKQKDRKEQEAIAWIKKYFKADSFDKIFLLLIIRGIKDNILSSKPIQAPSQFDDETEISELMIIIKKNKIFKLLKINKVYNKIITLWCICTKDFDSLGISSLFNVIKIQLVYYLPYQGNPFYQALHLIL